MPSYNPPNACYSEVPLPMYVNAFTFIGLNGSQLKYITDISGCQYIWVDFNRRVVEIWGGENRLPKGIAMIRRRINKLTKLTVPPEFYMLEPDLKLRISVKSWDINSQVYYEINGESEYTYKFANILLFIYPYNPYMTMIHKRTSTGIIVARAGSIK